MQVCTPQLTPTSVDAFQNVSTHFVKVKSMLALSSDHMQLFIIVVATHCSNSIYFLELSYIAFHYCLVFLAFMQAKSDKSLLLQMLHSTVNAY